MSSISLDHIRREQNFGLATAAGIVAALIGGVLWAVVTVVTKTELGLMAIGVGFLVGRAIRTAGQGIDPKFGYLGALCALAGCVLGNLLSDVAFYADLMKIGLPQAFASLSVDLLTKLVSGFFKPMDLLFYAIAIYEGYKFSFKFKYLNKPSLR